MKNTKAVDILKQCIEEISKMTDDEYQEIKAQRGLQEKEYIQSDVTYEDIEIVLPNRQYEGKVIYKGVLDLKDHIDYDTKENSMYSQYNLDVSDGEVNFSPSAA